MAIISNLTWSIILLGAEFRLQTVNKINKSNSMKFTTVNLFLY